LQKRVHKRNINREFLAPIFSFSRLSL
jgi:hypothetical protein